MKRFVAFLIVAYCAAGALGASVAKPTCGGSSSSKNIQLVQPTNPPRECIYRINAYTTNVCQLRIDFAMTLAQPSLVSNINGQSFASCANDYFQVNDLRLCGIETAQHIYVPFNRTAGVTTVDLRFVLAARAGGNSGLPVPKWDFKVTQLECPTGAALRSADISEDFKPEARATIKDGFFVAPAGCLQYFPQATGYFTSFNYNNGNGVYPGLMNYAICFRRTTRTSSLELQTHFFRLGAEDSTPAQREMDNFCLAQTRSFGRSEDYLLVPQSDVGRGDVRASYFCGSSIQGDTIRSTNPGPLTAIFNSDGIYKAQKEMGFAFSYKVL